jgi:hypothetical protein
MPRMRFEPTITVFERAKTFHVLNRTTTVIGSHCISEIKLKLRRFHSGTHTFN